MKDQVSSLHNRNETNFWIERPLDQLLLDYASFDILQLRALHKMYLPSLNTGAFPYIKEESKRYIQIFGDERRVNGSKYVDHGVLPQEILERSESSKRRLDHLGTRDCNGCRRQLHQDSFARPFTNSSWSALCYTCAKVDEFQTIRRRRY